VNPFTSVTQGFGTVTGTLSTPNYGTGIANLPPLAGINVASEISVSSADFAFNNIVDPEGNYILFVPLQVDRFTYTSANLQIVDPVSNNIVNIVDPATGKSVKSLTIDLSGLSTDILFQIATIHAFVDCYKMDTDCSKQCD